MAQLTTIERGLSPHSIRQIYQACVNNVADYGSPVWWRNQTSFSEELQKLQNLAMWKILGVFKIAPIRVMEIEAGLFLPDIRLNFLTRRYAYCIKTGPRNHPVKVILSRNFPEDTNINHPTQLEIAFASVQTFWPEHIEKID